MFEQKRKFIFVLTISVFLTFGLTVSFQSLLAVWTAPSAAPPGGNVSQVLTVGSDTQTKEGPLYTRNWFIADLDDDTFVVDAQYNRVGIGTNDPVEKLDVDGEVLANGFYDKDNSSYYLDPNSNSLLKVLAVDRLCDEKYENCIDMSKTGKGQSEDLNSGCRLVSFGLGETNCPNDYLAVGVMNSSGVLLSPDSPSALGYLICCAYEF